MANKKNTTRGAFCNTLESLKDFGGEAGSSVTSGAAENLFEQLFGWSFDQKSSGNQQEIISAAEIETLDTTKGEIFDITKLRSLEVRTKRLATTEHSKKQDAPGYDYQKELFHDRKVSQQDMREITNRVDEIMHELRKLISSSKILQVQFAETTMDNPPAEVGTYHVNFFEWLLSVIKVARERVEDSSMWLTAINAKSSKKTGYWGMFKKHGTTFGLSHERSVATQTG